MRIITDKIASKNNIIELNGKCLWTVSTLWMKASFDQIWLSNEACTTFTSSTGICLFIYSHFYFFCCRCCWHRAFLCLASLLSIPRQSAVAVVHQLKRHFTNGQDNVQGGNWMFEAFRIHAILLRVNEDERQQTSATTAMRTTAFVWPLKCLS